MEISYLILAITAGISFWAFQDASIKEKLLLYPYRDWKNNTYYTLITSGFIHADFNHLLFNLLSYYFFAPALSQQIGGIPFLGLYFFSLIVSDLPSFFQYKKDPTFRSLGASGAVSAVIFAFLVKNLPLQPSLTIYVFLFPLPAWLFGILFLGYSYWMTKKGEGTVHHAAHLYGALSGILFMLIYDPSLLQQLWHLLPL
jgi:membrane associated rhomboid family serine protease